MEFFGIIYSDNNEFCLKFLFGNMFIVVCYFVVYYNFDILGIMQNIKDKKYFSNLNLVSYYCKFVYC